MPIPKEPANRYNLVRTIRETGHRDCGVYVVKKEAVGGMYVKKTAFGQEAVACICREYRALRVLDHPNITKMVESFANMDTMMGAIIVEYFVDDLTTYINETHRNADRGIEAVKNVFKDMAAALAYCHFGIRTPNDPLPNWDAVIHKAVKLENIFIRPSNNAPGGLIAILGDFGWATNEAAERQLRRVPRGAEGAVPGDANWAPPEAPYFGKRSDVWGLATVMACLCQRVTQPRELRKTFGNYNRGGEARQSYYEIDPMYGRRLGEIVKEMSREDVARRWDSRKVFQKVEVGVVYDPHAMRYVGIPPPV